MNIDLVVRFGSKSHHAGGEEIDRFVFGDAGRKVVKL